MYVEYCHFLAMILSNAWKILQCPWMILEDPARIYRVLVMIF